MSTPDISWDTFSSIGFYFKVILGIIATIVILAALSCVYKIIKDCVKCCKACYNCLNWCCPKVERNEDVPYLEEVISEGPIFVGR